MYLRLSFLLFSLLFAAKLHGQLPQKGKIYFDDGKYSQRKILEYDPTQPVSSNNPKPTGIIERGHGLAVSPVLGSSDTTLTFYACSTTDTTGAKYFYYNPATASWVNTGHNCYGVAGMGAGGGLIFSIDGTGNIFRYDGTGNDTMVFVDTAYGFIADLVVDCEGNFYHLRFTDTSLNGLNVPQTLYKRDANGSLLQTWTMPSAYTYQTLKGAFALVGSEFYLGSGYRVPTYSTDSVSIVSGLITPSNVTFVSNTPKLPQFGHDEQMGDMASSSEPVKLPTVSIASSQTKLCLGASALVTASVLNADEFFLYEWYINGQKITGSNGSTLSFTPSDGDIVTCKISPRNLCNYLTAESNPIQFDVLPPPNAKITIQTPEEEQCYNDTIQVKVENVPGNAYLWNPGKYLYSPDTGSIALFEAFKGYINVKIRDSFGCVASDSIEVAPKYCCWVFIPSAFSPNGDGLNDNFNIYMEPGERLKILEVYNRFGQRIFSTYDATKGWDGKFNGLPVEIGSYFYYASFFCGDGNSFVRKGDITVVR